MHSSHLIRKYRQITAHFLLVIFFAAVIQPILAADEQQRTTPYDVVAKQYLASLADKESAEKKQASAFAKQNAEAMKLKDKNPKMTLMSKDVQIQPLGDVEKFRLVYDLFSRQSGTDLSGMVSPNVLQDLEVLCGYAPTQGHHLFGVVDNTQTTQGKIELQKMLATTADVETLVQRQKIVQALLADEKLLNTLDNQLKEIHQNEQDFFWFWKSIDEASATLFDKVYFHKRFFYDFSRHNQSEIPLELLRLSETIGQPVYPFMATFVAIETVRFISYCTSHHVDPTVNELVRFLVAEPGKYGHGISALVKFLRTPGLLDALGVIISSVAHGFVNLPTSAKIGVILWIMIDLVILAYPVYLEVGIIRQSIDYNNVCHLIHEKMNRVASFSNAIDDIGKLVDSNEALRAGVADADILINTADKQSKSLVQLRSLLATNTFKGDPSFFSLRGRVLAAFSSMKQVKDDFVKSLQVAGQLDAYVSIVKFYKQMQAGTNAHVCFVEYEQADRPHLALTNFWHPFLNPATVVTNSIELGGTANANNVILTGPNAAGKSTALKAIIIAVLLAQTLGIAPADRMIMTPFASVNSYLNIADTEGRESLFQAEMRRAQQLINSIRVLPRGQFSFVIMDEIFTGTNPEEGQAGAYGIAKYLANINKSMCIIATHFKKLTELEKDTAGCCKNYKVCAIKNANGSFTYPYKLELGVTDQAIALDLLQNEGFDSEIMNSAQQVMQEIQAGKRAQFATQPVQA